MLKQKVYKIHTHYLYMGFKKSGDAVGSEIALGTENWNVAKGYTHLKILQLLYALDRYDTLAQFGTEDLDQDQLLSDNDISKRRVEGLQRFHSTLKQLIGNVIFALKKDDKPSVEQMKTRLTNLNEFIPKTFENKEDRVSHENNFAIDEKLFAKVLEILQEIKDELNTPLNNANLIFRASEEIDLDKIMDGIVEGG